MRLSLKEVRAIKLSASEIIKEIPFKIFLYGSRVDDHKKGGDIDLLIVTSEESRKKDLVELKSKIRMRIFDFIPEQKIDITVATEDELKTDPFFQSLNKFEL